MVEVSLGFHGKCHSQIQSAGESLWRSHNMTCRKDGCASARRCPPDAETNQDLAPETLEDD